MSGRNIESGGYKYEGSEAGLGYDESLEYVSRLENKAENLKKEMFGYEISVNDERYGNYLQILEEIISMNDELFSKNGETLKDKVSDKLGLFSDLNNEREVREYLQNIDRSLLKIYTKFEEFKLLSGIKEKPVESKMSFSKEEAVTETNGKGSDLEEGMLGKLNGDADLIKGMTRNEFRNYFMENFNPNDFLEKLDDGKLKINFGVENLDPDVNYKIEKSIGLYELFEDNLDEMINDPNKKVSIENKKSGKLVISSREGRRFLDTNGKYVPVWSTDVLNIENISDLEKQDESMSFTVAEVDRLNDEVTG